LKWFARTPEDLFFSVTSVFSVLKAFEFARDSKTVKSFNTECTEAGPDAETSSILDEDGVKQVHGDGYERLEQMVDAPANASVAEGAFPNSPVDWNWPRPLRFAHECYGFRIGFPARNGQSTCARYAHCRWAWHSDVRGRTEASCRRAYPEFEVTRVWLRKNPDQAVEIWLERRGKRMERLFNPYTGADLGDSLRIGFRFVLWLVDLHDNLLGGQTGRLINAAGGIFTLLLGLTGAIIWWPGIDTWIRSLSFRWKTNPKGFNWTLHSALGFWTFLFFFMWAISGIYLSIPGKFNAIVDFLEPLNASSRNLRFGDQVLFWLTQLHFGRFAGVWVKIIWTIVGLVPAALFVTGTLMWWKRVLKPWIGRKAIAPSRTQKIEAAAQSGNSIHGRF
jgi:hypothetical protein